MSVTAKCSHAAAAERPEKLKWAIGEHHLPHVKQVQAHMQERRCCIMS